MAGLHVRNFSSLESSSSPQARRFAFPIILMAFDAAAALQYSVSQWETNILPSLTEYCKIPNQRYMGLCAYFVIFFLHHSSPAYDPDWAKNGLLEKAAKHLA
jgi:hypothetical protein